MLESIFAIILFGIIAFIAIAIITMIAVATKAAKDKNWLVVGSAIVIAIVLVRIVLWWIG